MDSFGILTHLLTHLDFKAHDFPDIVGIHVAIREEWNGSQEEKN